MKKGSVFFIVLFLSIFLFAVLPMVSADHCEEIVDVLKCNSVGPHGDPYCKNVDGGIFSNSVFEYRCAYKDNGCKNIEQQKTPCIADQEIKRYCDSSNTQNGYVIEKYTGNCNSNGDDCEVGYTPIDCTYGCNPSPVSCRNEVSTPGNSELDYDSIYESKPLFFKAMLGILLIILVLVVVIYLKPKKNKKSKKK